MHMYETSLQNGGETLMDEYFGVHHKLEGHIKLYLTFKSSSPKVCKSEVNVNGKIARHIRYLDSYSTLS